MEIQSYNEELAMANLMFARIFNNISIDRVAKNGKVSNVKVNCVFGQRSRIMKNWENENKRAKMKLPMIVINRTGYTRTTERLNNLHNEVKREITSTNRSYDLMTPIPIDISYDVSIISKYPSDIDKIASNFMVFFNSDIYVTCIHPKYQGQQLKNQIIMNDSVSEEHPDELDGTMDDLITATFQFTFKTWLFAGSMQAKLESTKVISTYISTGISTYLSSYISNGIPITAEVSSEVSTEISTEVDTGDETYQGLIPLVNSIHIGYYPVPYLVSDIESYTTKIAERTSKGGDLYNSRDYYGDRLVWKIDPISEKEFPDNVKIYRE